MAIEIGNILYLSNKDLTDYGIPKNTIKDFGGIRNPESLQEYIYEYDKVYERSSLTRSKLPPKAQIIAQIYADKAGKEQLKTLDNTKKLADKFSNFYKVSHFTYFSKKGYSDQKAKALAMSMSVLEFLDRTRLPKRDLIELTGFSKREDLIKAVCELMKDEVRQDGTVLTMVREGMALPEIPTSYDRLRAKVDKYAAFKVDKRNNECDILIPKKNNDNAQIIGKPTGTSMDNFIPKTNINLNEFHAATLFKLVCNPGEGNKFDYVEIHKRYVKDCKKWGKQPASLSTIKAFFRKEHVKPYYVGERDGYSELDKLLPHRHKLRPKHSLYRGGIDGFQVDYLTGDRDRSVMLTTVGVFDYASEACTGFDVSFTETGLLVRNCYRNHLRMHGGKTYFEIDMDAGMANKADKTKELFDKVVGRVFTSMSDDPTGKHRSNAKSRFAERLLEEVNRFAQNMKEWKGTNVTSYFIGRKPNPDYARKHLATVNDGIEQIVKIINIYNNTPLEKYNGKSRIEKFKEMMDPEAEVIDPMTLAQLFNWSSLVAVRGDVIKITVNRNTYEYFIDKPYEWASKMGAGRRVKVYYDEDDMKIVYVFGWELDEQGNPIESFLGCLELGQRAYGDKKSQTQVDIDLETKQDAKRKDMAHHVLRKQLETEAYLYEIDASQYPRLKDLERVIKGARSKHKLETLEERYAEELQTDEAVKTMEFYREHFQNKGVKFEEKPKTVANAKDKLALLKQKFDNKLK